MSAGEGRDAEAVRDLLSSYFDLTREPLTGGNVEKFIGAAVMAVWHAPIAQEDDPGNLLGRHPRPPRGIRGEPLLGR